jgi:1-acyl-sn-glycerol-3-phosphate acyltransferase
VKKDRREPFRYRVLQAWARIVILVFIRRVDITGRELVPVDRPAVLASNHVNAMADVAAIAAIAPRFPHFLAAASWFKLRPARWLFWWGGALPIYRRRDSLETETNESTFAACHAALAAGDHLVIFPEGEMAMGSSLQPLRTGAARIALGAADEAGVRGVTIIPVGLVYDAPTKFRSIGEMHFAEPIEIDDWLDVYRADQAKAVRGITELLTERLESATVSNPSPEAAALLDRAAALSIADDADWPDEIPYARRNSLRRALGRAMADAGGESSPAYGELDAAVAAHARDLAALGIEDPKAVPALVPATLFARTRLRVQLGVLTPPAVLGITANAPTVALVLVARGRVKNPGWQLSVQGFVASFLSPIVWGAEYALLARRLGRRRAIALVSVGAVGGLAAIAFSERRHRLQQITWQERAENEQPADVVAARASRAAVRAQVDRLVGARSRAGLE